MNIHRFKVVARFGLMHIVATNICVWIKTLVYESLKEITTYHQKNSTKIEGSIMLESLRQHSLKNAGVILGTDLGPRPTRDTEWEPLQVNRNIQGASSEEVNMLQKMIKTTTDFISSTVVTTTPIPTTTKAFEPTTASSPRRLFDSVLNFLTSTTTTTSSTTTTSPLPTFPPVTTTEYVPTTTSTLSTIWEALTSTTSSTTAKSLIESFDDDGYLNYRKNDNNSLDQSFESLENLFPEALTAMSTVTPNATSCGRVNIMGTIVHDSAPYLYPFIVEYSLIGAVVIYVMWRHIGRYQK